MSWVCDPGETNPPFCLLLLQLLENFRIEVQNLRDVGTKFSLILMPENPILFNFQPLKQDLGPAVTRKDNTVN
jgi:cholesterol monooxygenase (side-chain-cleaving)